MNYDAAILADAPYAYWPLADAAGAQAVDASGNARHGTYQGGVALAQPGPGGASAAAFDGATGYVDVPSLAFAGGVAFTLCAWVYRTNASPVSATIVSRSPPNSLEAWAKTLLNYSDNALSFDGHFNGQVFTSPQSLPPATWAMVAVTSTAGGLKSIYTNGTLRGTSTFNDNPDWHLHVTRIGRRGPGDFWQGRIARVSYHAQALDASRIAAYHAAGVVGGSSLLLRRRRGG